jgi:hypothetical protein
MAFWQTPIFQNWSSLFGPNLSTVTHRIPDHPVFKWSFFRHFEFRFSNGYFKMAANYGSHFVKTIRKPDIRVRFLTKWRLAYTIS